MNATNNIATDLFYKIRSRFTGLKLGSEDGKITINPEEARFFDFDYTDDSDIIGHVSISLAEENSMKVYFSAGITDNMSSFQKEKWYKFLKELRQFAKRRLMAFDTRDIAKDNLDKRDYEFLVKSSKPKNKQKPVGESIMNENSSLYGTRKVSYQKLMDTKLIIKHTNPLLDDQQRGARSRNISAIFIENGEGERFKYPFIHLAGARAMQRHVANSGTPYDDIGRSITQMSEEISQLRKFSHYVSKNHLLNDDTNNIIEYSGHALRKLREQVARLNKQKSYEQYTESFYLRPALDVPQEVIQEYTDKFTIKNFKEDIKTVFPILYRVMQENSSMDYFDVVDTTSTKSFKIQETKRLTNDFDNYENWVMTLGEDTAITSSNEENRDTAIGNLQTLVGQHFPAGIKGKNAITSLDGIITDPGLIMQLKGQAMMDPDLDVRPLIYLWLETNAPDVLAQLDFGDMAGNEGEEVPEEMPAEGEEVPEEMPAEGEEVPEEMPAEGEEGAPPPPVEGEEVPEEMPAEGEEGAPPPPVEGEEMPVEGEEGAPPPPPMQQESFGSDMFNSIIDANKRLSSKFDKLTTHNDSKNKNLRLPYDPAVSDTDTSSVDTVAVSNFIFSFYDTEAQTFPKGPESVCIMVGKKFGNKAEAVARKLVHRMAPEQQIQGNSMRESRQYAKKHLTEGTITTEIDVPCSVDGQDLDSSLVEINYSVMYDGEIDYESVTCVDTGEDLLDAFMSLPQHEIDQVESKICDYEEIERGESEISRWESDRNHTDEMDWTESRARSGRMMSESTNRKKPMLSESVSARHTDSAAIARIKQLSGLKK